MKVLGIAVIIFGILLLVSTGHLALTEYDLRSKLDIGKVCGGILATFVVWAWGLSLIKKSNTRSR